MEITTRTLKIQYGDDMRRIKYEFNSFKDLLDHISKSFGLNQEEFVIKYLDEENDLISVYSEEEFAEYLKLSEGKEILKLQIVPKAKSKRMIKGEDEQENHVGRKFRRIFHTLQNYNLDLIIQNLLRNNLCKVVQNYICDECNTQIVGNRYHCVDCNDFDYCSTCYAQKNHDQDHQFYEVTAIEALKEALSRNAVDIGYERGNINQQTQENTNLDQKKEIKTETPFNEKDDVDEFAIKENVSEDVSPFEKILLDLESMGFKDRQKNIDLLKKYEDISTVIQELLNERFNDFNLGK